MLGTEGRMEKDAGLGLALRELAVSAGKEQRGNRSVGTPQTGGRTLDWFLHFLMGTSLTVVCFPGFRVGAEPTTRNGSPPSFCLAPLNLDLRKDPCNLSAAALEHSHSVPTLIQELIRMCCDCPSSALGPVLEGKQLGGGTKSVPLGAPTSVGVHQPSACITLAAEHGR